VTHAFPEIAVAAAEAKQFGKLRAGEEQRDAALESDQNGFREEVDNGSRAGGVSGKANPATITAVQAASVACLVASPGAISLSVAPINSEMADVTDSAVWRELQNSQNTSPPKRQEYRPACGGSPASEASPIAEGSR
jgi:hypothetical protein